MIPSFSVVPASMFAVTRLLLLVRALGFELHQAWTWSIDEDGLERCKGLTTKCPPYPTPRYSPWDGQNSVEIVSTSLVVLFRCVRVLPLNFKLLVKKFLNSTSDGKLVPIR